MLTSVLITNCLSGALQLHSIFMQFFADVAEYVENNDAPALDMQDLAGVLSEQSWWLR